MREHSNLILYLFIFLVMIVLLTCQYIIGENSMQINNPPDRVDWIKTVQGSIIRPHKIDIGTWNMEGILNHSVAHGISDITKIVSMNGYVINDDGDLIYPIPSANNGGDLYVFEVNATNIKLLSVPGGFFDTADFDSTAFNRGVIVFWVED